MVSYNSKLKSQSFLEKNTLESESLVDEFNMNMLKRVVSPELGV